MRKAASIKFKEATNIDIVVKNNQEEDDIFKEFNLSQKGLLPRFFNTDDIMMNLCTTDDNGCLIIDQNIDLLTLVDNVDQDNETNSIQNMEIINNNEMIENNEEKMEDLPTSEPIPNIEIETHVENNLEINTIISNMTTLPNMELENVEPVDITELIPENDNSIDDNPIENHTIDTSVEKQKTIEKSITNEKVTLYYDVDPWEALDPHDPGDVKPKPYSRGGKW